jgi:hypothetical protein
MVMEPTDVRHGDHFPTLWELDRSRRWTVHRQQQMGTTPMIISQGAGQEALQMPRMPEDHLIQTRAADAPHEALDLRMRPRTVPGHHHLLDPSVLDALPKGRPRETVAIAHERPRCLLPRQRRNDLLRGPLRRGVLGAMEVEHAPPFLSQEHQHEEDPERHRWYDKDIQGDYVLHVVLHHGLLRRG